MPLSQEMLNSIKYFQLRRYKHQQKLEKKTVATEDSKQLPNYCEENYNETDYYHQNGLYMSCVMKNQLFAYANTKAHFRSQRCAATAQLISTFVFGIRR